MLTGSCFERGQACIKHVLNREKPVLNKDKPGVNRVNPLRNRDKYVISKVCLLDCWGFYILATLRATSGWVKQGRACVKWVKPVLNKTNFVLIRVKPVLNKDNHVK